VAFEKIIFPFLKKIGTMWLAGTIFAAQEHFVFHLIRQKLISGIEKQEFRQHSKPRCFVFFFTGQRIARAKFVVLLLLGKSRRSSDNLSRTINIIRRFATHLRH